MSLVSFSEVSRFHGRQDVLNNVTFSLESGERVGLVGKNGAGKTTVIRLILEEENPDKGQVIRQRGLKIGYLPQEIIAQTNKSLLNLVLDTDPEYRRVEEQLKAVEKKLSSLSEGDLPPEGILALAERQSQLLHDYERLGGWEKESLAKKILGGLGFAENDYERDLQEFSGGWIMRAVLARLLLAKPDLLVLDEPTNHLDLESLMWLEGYLKSASSALLLVSHDRVFLNNVAGKILELRQGRVDSYAGDYEFFLATKAQRIATEFAAFENQQARVKELEKFIDKNRARASTAARAQSRAKELEKMDRLSRPEVEGENSFKLELPGGRRGPDLVAELTRVSHSYGPIEVFRDLSLNIRRGERLALVAPNGRGKSTLIKLLARFILPTEGTVKVGQNVDIGYFSQFQMDSLSPELTILEEFASVAGHLSQGAQRSVLGSFLFSGDDVFKKVKVLSGGEKTRLVLAKIMMGAPNLLLLDEPTNHLDIAGRQMLEEALADYPGTLILISHDRHFINKLATSIGILENASITVYPGDFDDYREIWLKKIEREEALAAQSAAPAAEPPPKAPEKKKDWRDPVKKGLAKRQKSLRQSLEKKEARLGELAEALKALDAILSDPATYQNGEKVKALARKKNDLSQELSQLEKAYEEDLVALENAR